MFPALSGRRLLVLAIVALAAVVVVSPGFAQSTGMLKGQVVDGKGVPIEKAKITIEFQEGINRKYEVQTDKNGEYIQIGLAPGGYLVTAQKDKLTQAQNTRVGIGASVDLNFTLVPGGGTMSKEEAAKNAAIKGLFDLGVVASKASDYDGAIAKFNEALAMLPTCFDCYYNIGFAHTQKKEYDKAEAAFQKAIELKADYIEAYNGLAMAYNAQKKFDQAQAASAQASELAEAAAAATPGGGGTAGVDALYNQGVIAWNAGKTEEAQKRFLEALKVNPDHADSHFQLGMTMINQGKLADAVVEFETYLKLAPEGQYAAQAKALIDTLKK